MTGLLRGAGDVARGFRFLAANPRLWGWVAAPALITLVLIVAVVAGVLWLLAPVVASIAVLVPAWLEGWVSGLLRGLVVVGLSVAGFLVYVSVTGALAGPFCEMLSEAIEERVTGVAPPGFSPVQFVRGMLVGLAHAARRLFVLLFTFVLVFALGALIPVIGPLLAAAIGALLAARAAAYDCYDAVLSRRLLPYRDKVAYLARHRGRTLGLGAAVAGMLLVPVVNLVALGVGAAGATLAAIDLDRAGR